MTEEQEKFLRSRNMDSIISKAQINLKDDKAIERVEIVVLKYKSPEMEKDCVSRIIEYTEWPYKLNILDNRENGPNTSKAWNKLIRESTCDYILFIDSDAFVHNTITYRNLVKENGICWLAEMMSAFKRYKNVAIVGPVCGTFATSTMQSMAPKDMDPFPIDGHLSGYCFLTPKSIYEKIGYFDEDFCFYGQESDWIERIMESNRYDSTDYKIVLAPRAHVAHGYGDSGSQAALQAQKDGEMDMSLDASYSYLTWNMKKKERMEARGLPYEFKS